MPWGGRGGDCGCYLPGGTWGIWVEKHIQVWGPQSPEAREGGKDSLLSSEALYQDSGEMPRGVFHDPEFLSMGLHPSE